MDFILLCVTLFIISSEGRPQVPSFSINPIQRATTNQRTQLGSTFSTGQLGGEVFSPESQNRNGSIQQSFPQNTGLFTGQNFQGNGPSRPTSRPSKKGELKATLEEFKVTSKIQLRYAHTTVETYVKNPTSEAQEITFTMVLPSEAFISNFSMVLGDNQEHVARVEEKEKAKFNYESAVNLGKAAGLVQQDSRNSNQMSVAVNVEPQGKVRFKITYEELLQRHLDKYQHTIHVNLDQVVEEFEIKVLINESLPIKNLRVPPFQTDPNAITDENAKNVEAEIMDISKNTATIVYRPSLKSQKQFIKKLWTGKERLSGQLIVQYDVDRSQNGGNEIQVLDGYFVHFFAPEKLDSLPKHIVFVIDISGSMEGEKMQQTKDAMVTILDDLTERDHFNLIIFSDEVSEWKLNNDQSILTHKGTKDIKDQALKFILNLVADGGTNIYDSMTEGLHLIQTVRNSSGILPPNTRQIIIFLTDGAPTVGETDPREIQRNVIEINNNSSSINKNGKFPIYGLAFGRDADYNLIRNISVSSDAYARRIFEGSDAALQLEDFYLQLANPLLNDVTFKYVRDSKQPTNPFEELTNTDFKTYFKGNEMIVAGKIHWDGTSSLIIEVQGQGEKSQFNKTICYKGTNVPEGKVCDFTIEANPGPPPKSEAENFIERLWAFLSIKNLLDENLIEAKERRRDELTNFTDKLSRREKALELALQYNFVTEITSLVITRPEDSKKVSKQVEIVSLDKDGSRYADVSPQFAANPTSDSQADQAIDYDTSKSESEDSNVGGSARPGSNTQVSTTPRNSAESGECILSLFSKTYNRGESKLLTADASTLNNFDDKTTSVEVKGPCCWMLYTEQNFAGESKKFRPGKYPSSADMENLFRTASSVKKLDQCRIVVDEA